MKIAIVGYGKMGKVIERIALERGHEIVLRKNSGADWQGLEQADVAIEFSLPETAYANLQHCINAGIPTVCGTTGWLAKQAEIEALTREKQSGFIYGSNFSLGVNLFFELNRQLAELMQGYPYQVSMQEIHHTQKLDAPSGTALTLAKEIMQSHTQYEQWELGQTATSPTHLPIEALRIGTVPGTHTVTYANAIDQISITHQAHSREGFALGAVIAAEWLKGKSGVFTMKDVLGLATK